MKKLLNCPPRVVTLLNEKPYNPTVWISNCDILNSPLNIKKRKYLFLIMPTFISWFYYRKV